MAFRGECGSCGSAGYVDPGESPPWSVCRLCGRAWAPNLSPGLPSSPRTAWWVEFGYSVTWKMSIWRLYQFDLDAELVVEIASSTQRRTMLDLLDVLLGQLQDRLLTSPPSPPLDPIRRRRRHPMTFRMSWPFRGMGPRKKLVPEKPRPTIEVVPGLGGTLTIRCLECSYTYQISLGYPKGCPSCHTPLFPQEDLVSDKGLTQTELAAYLRRLADLETMAKHRFHPETRPEYLNFYNGRASAFLALAEAVENGRIREGLLDEPITRLPNPIPPGASMPDP